MTPLFTIAAFSFNLQNIQIDFVSNNILGLSGSGIAALPGLDPTTMSFGLSGNQFWQAASFSGGVATPEPGIMALMDSELVGLGF